MASQTPHTYRIPKMFYWDHVARELPAGTLQRECRHHLVVLLNEEEYEELLSDAKYYAFSMGDGGFDGHALISSALHTFNALRKVGA